MDRVGGWIEPSPNFVFLGDLRGLDRDLGGVDRLARVSIEANATTPTKLARLMREREGSHV